MITPLAVSVGTIATSIVEIFVILVVIAVGFLFIFRDIRPAWREGTALGAFKIFLRTSDGIDDVSTSCVDLTFQIKHAGGAVLKMLSSVVRSKNFEVDDAQRREFLALILSYQSCGFHRRWKFSMGFGRPQIFPFEEASSLVSPGKGQDFRIICPPLIKEELFLGWTHHKKYHRR